MTATRVLPLTALFLTACASAPRPAPPATVTVPPALPAAPIVTAAAPVAPADEGGTRKQQCNRLIDRMNVAVGYMEAYEKKKSTTPKEAADNARELGRQLTTARAAVHEVKVTDVTLLAYQVDYEKMLERFVALMDQQALVVNEQGLERLQEEADRVAADEEAVVSGMNRYCQSPSVYQ